MRAIPLLAGLASLALVWLGPLPDMARASFSAHMALHISVVAIAAPLLAWGIGGGRFDPVRRAPAIFAPIPASMVELIVVWGWHAPALHAAARHDASVFVAEQATFLGAGLLLWLAAASTSAAWRPWAAAGALLFTSIHMTLLGALFTFATRPLYLHEPAAGAALAPMVDQQLGGAIMLLVGGASYLAGALWLLAGGLRSEARAL